MQMAMRLQVQEGGDELRNQVRVLSSHINALQSQNDEMKNEIINMRTTHTRLLKSLGTSVRNLSSAMYFRGNNNREVQGRGGEDGNQGEQQGNNNNEQRGEGGRLQGTRANPF